jgi:hypothetical protein
MKRVLTVCGTLALSTTSLMADFSYHETTKITGGVMAGVLKVAGVFSKAAREPIEATVALKGNRMAHRSTLHGSIIDLDQKTITDVDLQKKTYSVMTFDEMKQALEDMQKKMKEKNQNGDADFNFKVSAEATGKRKQIAGYDAQEMLIKMQMEGTDKKSGQSGSMVVYSDVWMANSVPGYGEVRDFYKKMAAELNWAPGGNMFMAQPQVAKGFAEAMKEVSKQNGAPVFQMITMGPEGTPPPTGDPDAAQQKESKPKPSAGSVIGGALGGKFGLGRKKSQPEEQPQQQGGQQQGGALIEMQTEYSQFATTADASLFEIPAGFKQVESPMKKGK